MINDEHIADRLRHIDEQTDVRAIDLLAGLMSDLAMETGRGLTALEALHHQHPELHDTFFFAMARSALLGTRLIGQAYIDRLIPLIQSLPGKASED
ncbi:MAG TPA: hypothetical protein VGE07_00125 [Herpetosiphonaceae bacterium]